MAKRRPTRSSNGQRLAVALLVIVALGSLTYGVLRVAGFLGNSTPIAQKKSREGLVPVPKSLTSLKAFSKVNREDVYDLKLGDDSYFWLPKAQVDANPDWMVSVDQIIGRVMARDKSPDFVFQEKDFLPEGSRTGLMGGVPVGKQGFFLDVDQIPGLRFLKKGDRFDLLVNLPEETRDPSAEYGLLMGGIRVQGGKPVPVTGIRMLAQGAELIALTTNRTMTTQGGLSLSTTDANGRPLRDEKEERVLIAISPQESVPLTDALGNELTIHAVIRSGQGDVEDVDVNELQGMIAFPASAVQIPAFSRITAQDLADANNGELRRYYFQPADVRDEWIPRVEDLLGKVVARDIEPGYIFSPQDFLQPGSLIRDVEAFQPLSAADLVEGERSTWIGRVVARPLAAGQKLDDNLILPPGSLLRPVEAFASLSPDDLVEGSFSTWRGRVVRMDLPAGHRLTDADLLPAGSLVKDVQAFQALGVNDLVGGGNSPWLGRIASRPLSAGQQVEESMLLRPGAREGISSAIPANRLAMAIAIDKANGLEHLSHGDRIDLIESSQLDLSQLFAGARVSPSLLASFEQRAVNRVVANDVLVLDKQPRQIVLAVAIDQASAVTRALAAENKTITAVTRAESGTPTEASPENTTSDEVAGPASGLQSDPDPLDSIVITRVIIDGRKSEMAFRRDNRE